MSMCESDAKDFLHEGSIFEGSRAQFGPIFSLPAVDDIVESGKGVFPMIQVPMQHGFPSNCAVAFEGSHGKDITDEMICFGARALMQ